MEPSPEIIENYRDYHPPFDVRAAVRRALRYVPPKYLLNLKSIVLNNTGGFNRQRRRAWTRSRGKKTMHAEALGLYHPKWGNEPAWVELFVDNLVENIGSPWW
ncbi:MAG: hypothetical protein ACREF9_20805, partial [Opitutaceae bacterium]